MAEKGSLVVFVTTARMAIPVKNAYVSILEPKTKNVLGFRVTNSEGLTDIFETETPNVALSLEPQNGNDAYKTPFSVFDVQIDHPMYEGVLIENVQVFSGKKSIQNVDLIPMAEFSNPKESVSVYPISPQSL